MRKRVHLCPEITDVGLRSFLDMVPSIRTFQTEIVKEQQQNGECLTISLLERDITVCLHRADSKEKRPVVFEFHGGGFVLGNAEKNDSICRELSKRLNCHVIGINYRLAPEYPYPAALNDVYDTICYFQENEAEFKIDTQKMAVMGYSAGATLAAAAVMKSLKEQKFHLCGQVLHYPFLDSVHMPSEKEHYDCDMDEEILRAFTVLYAKEEERNYPYVSPICADKEQLRGAPSACILPAEKDSLKQEGLLYAQLLQAADVPVYCHVIPDVHHGYLEDAANSLLYEEGTAFEVKKLHSPYFKDWANAAIGITGTFLKQCFKEEGNE